MDHSSSVGLRISVVSSTRERFLGARPGRLVEVVMDEDRREELVDRVSMRDEEADSERVRGG